MMPKTRKLTSRVRLTITGGADGDEGSVSFDISGEVTYMTPTITTQQAN